MAAPDRPMIQMRPKKIATPQQLLLLPLVRQARLFRAEFAKVLANRVIQSCQSKPGVVRTITDLVDGCSEKR